MTNHGDDCYFYYYSTCTKGDSCPFRHCEAAVGNEIVCNLWEEGRCFRPMCKFRHFQITHNRKEIACYWENQPAGCQKQHCAFFHEKPRYIDGLYVPPDKGVKKTEEAPQEELVPAPPPLPTASNPQVRGVKKNESQEPVPSPTHPPVVINPADDDEDEDDQFSEEGEVGVSPRKQPGPNSDGSLNFGVSTLEEIRLRRALKASMKRSLYTFSGGDPSANGGKENIQSSFRQMREDDEVPLRRSLAERLGRVMDEEQPAVPCQRSSKSVKQRLQLPPELIAAEPPATKSVKQRLRLPPSLIEAEPPVETNPKKPEQIRIKTLEEIKQEKAAKSQKERPTSEITFTKKITTKTPKAAKRAITVKDSSIANVRTFSEILHAKKKRQEENEKLSKPLNEKSKDKNQGKSETAASQAKESVGEIKVKTLEEIRREKAARLQAQEAQEPEEKSPENQESSAKKPRLLRFKKVTSPSQDISQKNDNVTEKEEEHLQSASAPAPQQSSGNSIKVKTFEEIMREKRLRKQDTEEQPKATAEPPPQKTPSPALRRKVPTKISFTPDSSTTSEPVLPQAKATPAPVINDSSMDSEADSHSHKPASKDAASLSKTVTPQRRTNVQTTQETAKNTKVKPKLNVKPSVVKPTAQLKPGQKRKAPQRSAVAAVKPLNSTSKQSTDGQVLSSVSSNSAQSSDLFCTVTSSDSACKSSPVPPAPETPAPDTSTVTQSRSLRSPTPAKGRKSSVSANRNSSSSSAPTSAVDEFEDLISEFTTDEALDDSVDPALGEDDLLQELSEMIDS